MRKYFTVEEANRALPLVRRIVEDVVSTHLKLAEGAEEYRNLDPASPETEARRRAIDAQVHELAETVNGFINELHDLGVLFKGFEEGLVDFYSMLDGRAVFLCWKFGEDQVEWWHELESGYAGRQRLADRSAVGGNSGGR